MTSDATHPPYRFEVVWMDPGGVEVARKEFIQANPGGWTTTFDEPKAKERGGKIIWYREGTMVYETSWDPPAR